MSGDPLKRISTGQSVHPSASRENALTEAVHWVRQQQGKSNAPSFRNDLLPSGIVLVQNTTASDLPINSILGLSEPIILPTDNLQEYRSRIAFKGTTPGTTFAGRFCVLAEPILSGGIGRAWIDGTPQVEIEVTSTSHKFAEVSTTTARLKSAVRGSAKILWAESGIGNKAAIVRLVAEQSGGDIFSEGASCGCCDPTHCASYTQPLSNSDCEEGPFGWEVNFGSALTLNAFCAGMPVEVGEAFELEYISYGVWKSAAFSCLGSALVGGCNDEGGSAACCTGSAEMHWDQSDLAWTETSNDCSDGCNGQTPGGNPGVDGDVTVPCINGTDYDIYVSTDGATWSRTGGNCAIHLTPDAGTYPPVSAGDTRSFPCCDSDPVLPTGEQYAWIQLTVNNARDAENRSRTTLELMVGDVAAFTYVLPIGRDFCCTCEQKFELRCCGPWAFRFLPETVCLKPMAPGDFDMRYVDMPPGWMCCSTLDQNGDVKLPRFLTVTISGTAGGCDVGCCTSADGSWLMEWQDNFLQRWKYDFLGEKCFYDVRCEDTAVCFSLGPNLSNTAMEIVCTQVAGVWCLVFTLYAANYISDTSPACGGGDAGACGIPGCTTSHDGIVLFQGISPVTPNCFSAPIVFYEQGVPGGQTCELAVTAVAVT